MRIKKYIGNTSHEAMTELKNELGRDAVVLSTKSIRRKGIFKYLKKPLIEITAAYEEKDIFSRNNNRQNNDSLTHINNELIKIKESINNIPLHKEKYELTSSALREYNKILINNGVNPKVSYEVLKKIEEDIDLSNKDENTINEIVKYTLSEILGVPKPISFGKEQKIYFFIGPTGVGKTTTLAKIASNLVLNERVDIGLITSDTYRIAAVEQLRIYSNILQLPLEIAYNKDETIKAINKFKNKDIILIDTSGRNHNDLKQIQELNSILDSSDNKESFLLISANLDFNLLENLINKYEFLEDFNLIITKIDESKNYGSFLNVKYLTQQKLSYYTVGQNVPDDIRLVNIEEMVDSLLEENNDE